MHDLSRDTCPANDAFRAECRQGAGVAASGLGNLPLRTSALTTSPTSQTPMRFAARELLSIASLLTAVSLPASAQTFDFDAAPLGPVPFTLVSGGVSATFSAPIGGFELFDTALFPPGAFTTLDGQILGSVDADVIVEPLLVSFDQPITGLSLNFALNDFLGGSTLTLRAFLGAAAVGDPVLALGASGPWLPEGQLTIATSFFDRVEISSDAVDFFVDNLTVTTASVPEPATWLLTPCALVLLAISRRRNRRDPSRVA